jgi:hypothetical protein
MRYVKLALMLLLLTPAIALIAADPFIGTWKLNTAKSKFKTGTPYQEVTITVSDSGSDVDVIAKATAGGAPFSLHYTVPANGGTGKIIESSSYDAVSEKILNATEHEISFSKGGKVIYTTHSKVSKDGKTLTVTSKGTNSTGQVVDFITTYDKQ